MICVFVEWPLVVSEGACAMLRKTMIVLATASALTGGLTADASARGGGGGGGHRGGVGGGAHMGGGIGGGAHIGGGGGHFGRCVAGFVPVSVASPLSAPTAATCPAYTLGCAR